MKPFEKLGERIKKDLDIDLVNFKRIRTGWSQRASGAWSWVAQSATNSFIDYGSQFGATELIKYKGKLVKCRDNSILPDD